jgi:hypothetical protein
MLVISFSNLMSFLHFLGVKTTMKICLMHKYLRGCIASKNDLTEHPVLISCDKFDEQKAMRSEKKYIADEE